MEPSKINTLYVFCKWNVYSFLIDLSIQETWNSCCSCVCHFITSMIYLGNIVSIHYLVWIHATPPPHLLEKLKSQAEDVCTKWCKKQHTVFLYHLSFLTFIMFIYSPHLTYKSCSVAIFYHSTFLWSHHMASRLNFLWSD